ncbi:hypothetical protein [Ramlibacter rhizophilus]|uniref:Histidine kinase n=1 Tax=Ramlibacter rhizophilus TaxID=1781167 RepID=A0A4Z0BIP0_9BURK|nr:hypothetical protein [Ramlibacter rhizophilus]TFY98004.1 hypothetical protein EZ242_16270 [Ramlibacter rhizophilus]
MTSERPHLSPAPVDAATEAARYALLRRLAFAIRHDLMAELQPITMTGEVLERRLAAPQPDLKQLRESAARITGFSRAAVRSCLDVITWMAPEPGRTMPVQQVVRDTVDLLGSSFGFRGFVLRNDAIEAPWSVPRTGLRQLLPACLFLLADEAGPPAEITLGAQLADGQVRVVLSLEPVEGPEGVLGEPPYRALSAAEVQLLARAEGIAFTRTGDHIELVLAQVPPEGE